MYGVYIKPDIGNAYYLDADDNQVMGYLGSVKIGFYNYFYPNTGWNTMKHNIPEYERYNIIIIPRIVSRTYKIPGSYYWFSSNVTDYNISSDNFNFYVDERPAGSRVNSEDAEEDPEFMFDFYGYPKSNNESWGIRLHGMNGISELTPSMRGYCVFAEVVKINGGRDNGWRMPSYITSEMNPVIFVRPKNSSALFSYNRVRGLVVSSSCEMYVVIFCTNFKLEPPKNGIVIYNDKKEITFSSNYKPMKLGETTRFSNRNGASFSKLKKPMIIPDAQFVNWKIQGRNRDDVIYMRTGFGFENDGNRVYWDDIYAIGSEYGGSYGAVGGNAFRIEFNIYGIELSDYFNI
ncbi:hypothetical protein F3Y08_05015 [Proteus mirabilis]|uniref:hypothetical protein n=1 Tax=Proteus mirabilis TaxID=584 RepID=UPI00123DF88D|nr:hypothetical protein [Proteus mirabilis]QES77182.1 hypothetical protein F3Y08_05015 [Proteus mirabilis]